MRAVLTVRLTPEDYKDRVKKKLKEYAYSLTPKGFRKGHTAIIEQRYGKAVLEESVLEQAEHHVQDYLDTHKLPLFTRPLLDIEATRDIEWLPNNTFEFRYLFDLVPEFSVVVDKGIVVKEYQVAAPTEEEVEDYLQDFLLGRDDGTACKRVAPGTTVFATCSWAGVEKRVPVKIEIPQQGDIGSCADLLEAQVDDTVELPAAAATQLRPLVPGEDLAGLGGDRPFFKLDINHICLTNPTSVVCNKLLKDPNLAAEDRARLREVFKEMLKNELIKKSAAAANQKLTADLRQILVRQVDIPLADRYQHQKDNVTWLMIVKKLAAEEGIAVSHQEVLMKVAGHSQGNEETDKSDSLEKLTRAFERLLARGEGQDMYQAVYLSLLEDKVVGCIKTKVTVEAVPMTYRELVSQLRMT